MTKTKQAKALKAEIKKLEARRDHLEANGGGHIEITSLNIKIDNRKNKFRESGVGSINVINTPK